MFSSLRGVSQHAARNEAYSEKNEVCTWKSLRAEWSTPDKDADGATHCEVHEGRTR